MFFAVYKEELQKTYTYSTSEDFDLDRVMDLILAEVNSGAFLKKNSKFEATDFDKVRNKVDLIN